jgi:hypothetical protein
VHVSSVVVWLGACLGGQIAAARARGGEPEGELRLRRRLSAVLGAEHLAFVLVLASGALLMGHHGWRLGHPRWLTLKLGVVAFLVTPLEAMHAFVIHVWIARGLRRTGAPPFARDLVRGIGVEEMLRTLAIPLWGLGLPLIVWLSVARPF